VHATVHITSTTKRLQSRPAVTESIETLLRGVDAKPTAYCCNSSETCEAQPYATLRDTIDTLLCIQQSCTYTTYYCYFVVQAFELASSQTRAARTDATRNACASGSNVTQADLLLIETVAHMEHYRILQYCNFVFKLTSSLKVRPTVALPPAAFIALSTVSAGCEITAAQTPATSPAVSDTPACTTVAQRLHNGRTNGRTTVNCNTSDFSYITHVI
jgi:hypothetical protein